MNTTVIDANWKQIRAQARARLGQLSGDPRAEAAGRFDRLIGSLQERFGYSRKRAKRDLQRRIAKHAAHVTGR